MTSRHQRYLVTFSNRPFLTTAAYQQEARGLPLQWKLVQGGVEGRCSAAWFSETTFSIALNVEVGPKRSLRTRLSLRSVFRASPRARLDTSSSSEGNRPSARATCPQRREVKSGLGRELNQCVWVRVRTLVCGVYADE